MGLIPHFAKDEHYKFKAINARAETVEKLPSFRDIHFIVDVV
jgi:putative SOS response-associated peptidase YedK